jgi:hypothetical protein
VVQRKRARVGDNFCNAFCMTPSAGMADVGRTPLFRRSRMRMIALVLSAWLVSPAAAQDDNWIAIGRTDKATWHVKSGSVSVTEVQGNVPVVMVVGRITVHATSRITMYKWYVSVNDCERGRGQVVALTTSDEYRYRQDFVSGDDSAASGLAQYICGLYEPNAGERREP